MSSTGPAPVSRCCVACRVESEVVPFTVVERLLGTREEFSYWECPRCGCVQIESVPHDLARHYPPGYFAYMPQHRLAASRWRAA